MARQTRTAGERRTHTHMQSTTASETSCRTCRRRILNAWDEGLLVRVEADPLGAAGECRREEALAILDGRHTYVLTASKDLVLRTAARILDGEPTGQIHAQHVCRPADGQGALV